VTLHDAGEALALGRAGDVDALAGLEGVGAELLAEAVVARVSGAQLDDVRRGVTPAFSKWPVSGLVTLRGSIAP
jgi:hypothetical protein